MVILLKNALDIFPLKEGDKMKYIELLEALRNFSNEDLDLDVSIEVGGEIFGIEGTIYRDYSKVLDDDHPYLKVSE